MDILYSHVVYSKGRKPGEQQQGGGDLKLWKSGVFQEKRVLTDLQQISVNILPRYRVVHARMQAKCRAIRVGGCRGSVMLNGSSTESIC